MSVGKFSPSISHIPGLKEMDFEDFCFNAYGEEPAEWNLEMKNRGEVFDEKTMFMNYDKEGFDFYGYSAFNIDGDYVGTGKGIDRYGYTEYDYIDDSIRGGTLYEDLQYYGGEVLSEFKRKR